MCFHPYFQNHLVPSQTRPILQDDPGWFPLDSRLMGSQSQGPTSRGVLQRWRNQLGTLVREVLSILDLHVFSPNRWKWKQAAPARDFPCCAVRKEELDYPKKLRWLKFKKGLEIIAFGFAHGKKETCSKERWWFFKIGGNPWNLPLMVSFNGTFGARVLFEDQLKFPNSVWSWIVGCMLDFT